MRVLTLHETMVGRVRTWMLMLLGSVTLLLFIACANVANLMLARATVRGREMGLRAALGASRWRLTRALLVEGLLLSLAAAAIGIVISLWGVQALKAWMPDGIPRVADIAVDLRVLAATIAAAIVTGVTFRSGASVAGIAARSDRGAASGRALGDHERRRAAVARRAGRHRSLARRDSGCRRRTVHRQLRQGGADRSWLQLPGASSRSASASESNRASSRKRSRVDGRTSSG